MVIVLCGRLRVTTGAHHSFALHFDREKPVSIAKTITRFERRSPHQ
jgi:hypothetical protein